MQASDALHQLIRSRLVATSGSLKLSDEPDILKLGENMGFSENQMLFKVLEIADTIDFSIEKPVDTAIQIQPVVDSNLISEQNKCANCGATYVNGTASFCSSCGSALDQSNESDTGKELSPVIGVDTDNVQEHVQSDKPSLPDDSVPADDIIEIVVEKPNKMVTVIIIALIMSILIIWLKILTMD